MVVVYDTFTGNTEKFVKKLPYECRHISEYDGINPFIMVTYTINFGQVPVNTSKFLEEHGSKMLGVASSGNRNWGTSFAKAAEIISVKYKVPIIHRFELQGIDLDVVSFIQGVKDNVKMA